MPNLIYNKALITNSRMTLNDIQINASSKSAQIE